MPAGERLSPEQIKANAAAAAAATAKQQAGLQQYAKIAIAALDKGDYATALQAGLDSGTLYHTNYDSPTTSPLLADLESSAGLKALDPSKKWTPADITAYYKAFAANPVTTGTQAGTAQAGQSWGKNVYGTWGDPSKIAVNDSQANINTAGDNSAPDVGRFVGARPTQSVISKWIGPIITVVAAVFAPEILPALAPLLGGSAIAAGVAYGAAVGAISSAASGGNIGQGALLGGIGGGIGGAGLNSAVGGAVRSATGLGTTGIGGVVGSAITGAVTGAGTGAIKGAITGQGAGAGALSGAEAGAIGGAVNSAVTQGAHAAGFTQSPNNSSVQNALIKGGTNAVSGGLTGAITKAVSPTSSGYTPSSVSTTAGAPATATATQGLNNNGSPSGVSPTAAALGAVAAGGVASAAGSGSTGSTGKNMAVQTNADGVPTGDGTNTTGPNLATILGGLGSGLVSNAGTLVQGGLNQGLQNSLFNTATTALSNYAATIDSQANPDLTKYVNQQAYLLQQGKITPAVALAAVQDKSQLLGIQVPKQFTDAVAQTITQEQKIGTQGYTPVERAAIQSALQGVISQQKGQSEAIKTSAQARGQYGGGQALDLQQQALQGNINNASTQANQTEANAYTRALAAIQNSGQLGLTAGQQSFTQQAQVGQAQDAINNLNAQFQQQANENNAQRTQAANVLKSQQDLEVQKANQNEANVVSGELVGAANQTKQNQLAQEGLVANTLGTASKNATALGSPVYQNTQKGQAAGAGILNSAGSAIAGALKGAFGGGSSNSDPFAGTTLANNHDAFNAYNQNNGPTAGDISNLTSGSTTGDNSIPNETQNYFDNLPTPDPVAIEGYADGGKVKGYAIGGSIGTGANPSYLQNLAAEMAGPSHVSATPVNPPQRQITLPQRPIPQPVHIGMPQSPHVAPSQPIRVNPQPVRNIHPVMRGNAMSYLKDGGHVNGPGTETSDSIPVRLSKDEYVINAKSAKKYEPVLDAINNDHEDLISHLLPFVTKKQPVHSGTVLIKSDEPIDQQKALALALGTLSRIKR